jgi:RNA polymerase sigma-70 factor, ECF subfamily
MSSLAPVAEAVDSRILIRQLRHRDPRALENLYDRYAKRLHVEVYRIVRNSNATEDIVQETFLRLWNRAESLDESFSSLEPWLITVARNCCMDYCRDRARRIQFLPDNQTCQTSPPDEHRPHYEADRDRQLRLAVSQLPKQEREVLELAYYRGMTQRGIADHLHKPLGTVKSWSRHALKVLRANLSFLSS